MNTQRAQLGRLVSIQLREAWENEATEFTPWLASPENLRLLGEAIGLELELTGIEQSVGNFSADILCKDVERDEIVLIENQLERTDHSHLGQILTYAAGLNARTIIWISAKLREEHRAALDWLNENTGESLQFFGVEVELWRIGDSPLAPKFNVMAKPNDWSKTVAEAAHTLAAGALTETKIQQQKYWGCLSELLSLESSAVKPRKPLPQHWTNFSIGRSDMKLAAVVNSLENRIGVELYISNDNAKEQFRQLEQKKLEIEQAIGSPLDWQALPGKKAARIVIYKYDEDPSDESKWPRQHKWMMEMLQHFDRVFRPLVRELD